jgi:uncharacterized membrane protein HdeD (DUF308 family)
MKEVLSYWWMVLLKGLILIGLSLFVFRYPVEALVGLAVYIGISLLFAGILISILAITARHVDDNWGWRLAEGVIDILFAVILLSNPAITAAVFPFVVGFWMIVYGVMLFAGSFRAKKEGDSGWWMSLLGGLLTVLFGYFMTVNLVLGAMTITMWLGLGLLVLGLINLSASFRMRKIKSAIS